MPRKAKPWWRAGRKMWYSTIGDRQVPLGITDPTDQAGALAAFTRLRDAAATSSTPTDPAAVAATAARALLAALENLPAMPCRDQWLLAGVGFVAQLSDETRGTVFPFSPVTQDATIFSYV